MNKEIYLYSDLNKINLEEKINLISDTRSNFNSISSYLAMFPVDLPSYFIKKFTNENDVIMDNFSGRGTTAYASRKLNRYFVGNDLNPYAYVLTKSKLANNLDLKNILQRISELEKEYIKNKKSISIRKNEYNELKIFYSNSTLKQLIFFKNKIGINWKKNNNLDNLLLAIALGLMHGPMKKNGTTIYFSLSMPNTISMSSNYVKNYSEKYNLKKPNVNIFDNLKNRILNKYEEFLLKNYDSNYEYWNSINSLDFVKDESINLVFTSPPYLSVVDYTKSNWLKLWLLGFNKKHLKDEIKLSDSLNLIEYKNFIKKYLINIYPKLKSKAKVCLVIGDVYNLELIENVWKDISGEVPFEFIAICVDNNVNKFKTSKLLNSRSGKATKIDKILILQKK